ncbi:hypothetical protein CEXT_621181 [Caerostris extrusa]|uniref:Uncharacterized protein n=1 Tax=Caerostris extrusa TaxID=172846 RepID=A0AAV4XUT6_CAEEX|nr:hypothetical protein CEXT_621181 [Caerostris extrusa]
MFLFAFSIQQTAQKSVLHIRKVPIRPPPNEKVSPMHSEEQIQNLTVDITTWVRVNMGVPVAYHNCDVRSAITNGRAGSPANTITMTTKEVNKN